MGFQCCDLLLSFLHFGLESSKLLELLENRSSDTLILDKIFVRAFCRLHVNRSEEPLFPWRLGRP